MEQNEKTFILYLNKLNITNISNKSIIRINIFFVGGEEEIFKVM
jgi:hypothetical protein